MMCGLDESKHDYPEYLAPGSYTRQCRNMFFRYYTNKYTGKSIYNPGKTGHYHVEDHMSFRSTQ